MTKHRVGFLLAWITVVSIAIGCLFTFGSTLQGTDCWLYQAINPIFFYSIEIPYFTILVSIMSYTFYVYFAMANKPVPGVTEAQSIMRQSKMKVTKALLSVVGIFLVTNAQWYIIYFSTYNRESSGVVILQRIGDWIWLVSKIFHG